jgi:hypothetical protein
MKVTGMVFMVCRVRMLGAFMFEKSGIGSNLGHIALVGGFLLLMVLGPYFQWKSDHGGQGQEEEKNTKKHA